MMQKSHEILHNLIQSVIAAMNPERILEDVLHVEDEQLVVLKPDQTELARIRLGGDQRVFLVAVGKAGYQMAKTAAGLLGEHLHAGIVVTKYEHSQDDLGDKITVIEAGHPIPDQNGIVAVQALTKLLSGLGANDLVLCMISGGGSALLNDFAPELSLEDSALLNGLLLKCGASITEINTIRKHVSTLKGGQLARLIYPARLINFILSDVIGDSLQVIASGPTVPDETTFVDAWGILERYKLTEQLSPVLRDYLTKGLNGEIPETPKPDDPIFERTQNIIVGNNFRACQVVMESAGRQGLAPLLLTSSYESEVEEVARMVSVLADSLVNNEIGFLAGGAMQVPDLLILGGESTVQVKGDGKGGRNQHLALLMAKAIAGKNITVACFATDGTDGPTEMAGAIVDGSTISRAKALGLDIDDYIARSDSYHFFQKLGGGIHTGPTQTNVNDLILVLRA
jgi:glycerate 2-kinase